MSTALGNTAQRNAQRTTTRKCDASGHLVFDRGDWVTHAQCRGTDPDALFVRGAEQNKAKQLCAGCPVRTECLAEALDNQIEWGVWGGMTERERRALLRRRPGSSWRSILETARTKVETPSISV